MSDEAAAWFSIACGPAADDDWSITAEELPCLLDMRVTRAAGRLLPRLQGVVALGLAV